MLHLDDQIRELCARAIITEDASELREVLGELRAAIHEHTAQLRELAASYPIPLERRSTW